MPRPNATAAEKAASLGRHLQARVNAGESYDELPAKHLARLRDLYAVDAAERGGDGIPPTEPALRLAAELDRLVRAAFAAHYRGEDVDFVPIADALRALPQLPELPDAGELADAMLASERSEDVLRIAAPLLDLE